MPRIAIDPDLRSKTHTFSCRDPEWKKLLDLTVALKLHTPFDVVRKLVQESKNKHIRRDQKLFDLPRAASDRTLKIRNAA